MNRGERWWMINVHSLPIAFIPCPCWERRKGDTIRIFPNQWFKVQSRLRWSQQVVECAWRICQCSKPLMSTSGCREGRWCWRTIEAWLSDDKLCVSIRYARMNGSLHGQADEPRLFVSLSLSFFHGPWYLPKSHSWKTQTLAQSSMNNTILL